MTDASNEFARAFDSINKVVFSRSLHRVEDGSTRIVRTDLREEILKLKQQPGILVGGVDMPSQLVELVDEYRFVVWPSSQEKQAGCCTASTCGRNSN